MSPDVLAFAQVLALVASFATFGSALFIAVRFALARTGQPRHGPRAGLRGVDEDRFARLEQAVDAIAIEVERISEGQRHTARLLSERVADSGSSERGVVPAQRPSPRR